MEYQIPSDFLQKKYCSDFKPQVKGRGKEGEGRGGVEKEGAMKGKEREGEERESKGRGGWE